MSISEQNKSNQERLKLNWGHEKKNSVTLTVIFVRSYCKNWDELFC
jgi:hypothetical protein